MIVEMNRPAIDAGATTLLQWGRDQMIVEIECYVGSRVLLGGASMGPRSDDRGNSWLITYVLSKSYGVCCEWSALNLLKLDLYSTR